MIDDDFMYICSGNLYESDMKVMIQTTMPARLPACAQNGLSAHMEEHPRYVTRDHHSGKNSFHSFWFVRAPDKLNV